MDLKELGFRLVSGYILKRASGESRKDSIVGASISSTIHQAVEDISGLDEHMADVDTQVIEDLINASKSTKTNLVISHVTNEEVTRFRKNLENPTLGVTQQELESEVKELQAGITEGYLRVLKLNRLKAGILKRQTEPVPDCEFSQ